ncbi:MAG TPA: RHS repeat-associated core domain-containing protein [Verrucomicrobiae bacterium]|nr:RHS repeat-associated core domain-containing protein [Verrucomicrobiae bacterium]
MAFKFRFGLLLFALVIASMDISEAASSNEATNTAARLLLANPSAEAISSARVFEEPLVTDGGNPTPEENTALASALCAYGARTGPDDFSSLTGFLDAHPGSAWNVALLTDLGLEYYNTAHYSLAIEAWKKAWALGQDATGFKAKAIADRAAGELAYMYARLGRMTDLDALLKSVQDRTFVGPATERITGAREGLWNMQHRPGVSFRCGPLALQRIRVSLDPNSPLPPEILNSASTEKGFALAQVAELSSKVGLNYQMAFRNRDGAFVVPSVVHWKVGHYAALVRRDGNRYLLQDPTFGNSSWATKEALEAETSGYFLIPPGPLPEGWRAVEIAEGGTIWGKGQTGNNDPKNTTPNDPRTPRQPCSFDQPPMAVPSILLMLVSLNLMDEPAGYSPPVGPSVRFTVRYNHRDAFQPANFAYSNFGSKWTSDWISYITDSPDHSTNIVFYYARGGGTRSFPNGPGYEKYDQTLLRQLTPDSYELVSRDGSKLVFSKPDGSTGSSRKVFLTYVVDPAGNYVAIDYDSNLRITTITDAIGQTTTLTYGLPGDIYKVTKVTDPFGRFATFDYDGNGRLSKITDILGLTSQFTYLGAGDFITKLVTPYGTSSFTSVDSGNTRSLEILYPDNSRERVEYNQGVTNSPMNLPAALIPTGMATTDDYLRYRTTYYWSRAACAIGYGDYSKARIYHWLHTEDLASTAGALESTKEPLEGRDWYDYGGQSSSIIIGANYRPTHVGRVLDDGTSQVYTYSYDSFGHVISMTDPVGRKFSYLYSTNGIDLLEARQTRAGKNELLSRATYNTQHQALTRTDAAGETTTFTYNSRGQILTMINPKLETITFNYDIKGYLISIDGPLPGTGDTVTTTYDSFGRPRTIKDVNGYTVTQDYDTADRSVKVTFPDGTFNQYTYDRLDVAKVQDRAGRQTLIEHDSMRQMTKLTDPLGRVTTLEWCSCGDPKSLTDPMGRTTQWTKDVQGRHTTKQYGDGSIVRYTYEPSTSRLQQMIDENHQITQYIFNRDNTLKSVSFPNAAVPTPSVNYAYDADYERLISMTDVTGTTLYSYVPITAVAVLGAGNLAAVDGPLPNDTITYGYDELGRVSHRSINGVDLGVTYDAARRILSETNALGTFGFAYEGSSRRLISQSDPNGQTLAAGFGGNLQDFRLQQFNYTAGANPISQFSYNYDIPRKRITSWSQKAGAQSPSIFTFGYDAVDQLLSASITNSDLTITDNTYTYDPAGNRLTELAGGTNRTSTYNALNQINTTENPAVQSRTNEWDAQNRLTATTTGIHRTEFTYDGRSRLASIRQLQSGSEISFRRLVWCDNEICEERDAAGAVTKRYFSQGMKVETGPLAGNYFYTRDHLGSIHELTDAAGNLRARYAYDPFGRRIKVSGDVDADFGFAGMFWSGEASLSLTRFRAYDPELGRWLSRDPLKNAEMKAGPNLYSYVANNPVNMTDRSGLYTDAQLEMIAAKRAGQNVYGSGWKPSSWRTDSPPPSTPASTPTPSQTSAGEVTEVTGGEMMEVPGGEMVEASGGEMVEVTGGEIVDVTGGEMVEVAGGELMEVAETVEVALERAPALEATSFSGLSRTFGGFIGAGLTILTMTDCNTVNGILGLVRQGNGGVLNIYEDRLLKQLDNNP